MLKSIGAFIGMSVLLLAVGFMTKYIYGSVKWSTYDVIARAFEAFWLASGVLLIAGIVYRLIFNRLSAVCNLLFILSISIALVLTGFLFGP